jgi:hypothetical protein
MSMRLWTVQAMILPRLLFVVELYSSMNRALTDQMQVLATEPYHWLLWE